jgi:hypothetical protein
MPRPIFPRFQDLFGLIPAWMGLVSLLFLSIPARADVWAHIDEAGVAHFATEQVDPRYQLFFRGSPQAADTVTDRHGTRSCGAHGATQAGGVL